VESTYENITKEFNICNDTAIGSPVDVETLVEIVSGNIGSMAMVNYPYNTSFLHPLPPWPIKAMC
jgi:lysosomal Pro-X carboxypeptidase